MRPKPSVLVSKHHRNTDTVAETEEEQKRRKAERALELEVKRAREQNGHEESGGHHHHHYLHTPGVVHAIVAKHKSALHKRQEERARQRRGRFEELGLHYDDDDEDDAHGTSPSSSATTSSDALLHTQEVVDTLEVVDTQINTVATLSNIARSIAVPTYYAGSPPVVQLSHISDSDSESTESPAHPHDNEEVQGEIEDKLARLQIESKHNKHGKNLDKYVQSQLKRQEFKAKAIGVLKGTWVFVKTPLGIVCAIYGFLVIFSGAALVICLAGWVPGNKKLQVEIFSQSTNALFTITGVGLIPWRIRDTYIISRICHYRNLSNDMRKKRGLAKLQNPNDLAFEAGFLPRAITSKGDSTQDATISKADVSESDRRESPEDASDKAVSSNEKQDLPVETVPSIAPPETPATTTDSDIALNSVELELEHMLTPRQAARLRDLQSRFASNCTWYRPTETPTHHAFPIGRAVTVTAFIDLNSLFQCLMCGYMWGYATHYQDRPAWSTGSFLPLSFVSGIVAAIAIWIGSKKTEKKREVKKRLEAAFKEEEKRKKHEKSKAKKAAPTKATVTPETPIS